MSDAQQFCMQCGAALTPTAAFCPRCGAPVAPPVPGPSYGSVRPHRGAVILVLGILGLVACFPLGMVAWIMANRDLRAMQAGQMDPSGEGLTRAGKVLGIIVTVLWLAGVLLYCGLGACALALGV